MTIERKLAVPTGYDPAANPRVASFAAQLDDQLSSLKKAVAGLETRHLEWQPSPGVNTIGMLLAHLAVVDIWWMRIAPREIPAEPDGEKIMLETIAIRMYDDGLPLAADGRHPASLAGRNLYDYLRMLDEARAVTHSELRKWREEDLATTYRLRDRIITREWTVYHVLEHFCGHYGQIRLLKHLMVDEGALVRTEHGTQ